MTSFVDLEVGQPGWLLGPSPRPFQCQGADLGRSRRWRGSRPVEPCRAYPSWIASRGHWMPTWSSRSIPDLRSRKASRTGPRQSPGAVDGPLPACGRARRGTDRTGWPHRPADRPSTRITGRAETQLTAQSTGLISAERSASEKLPMIVGRSSADAPDAPRGDGARPAARRRRREP